MKQHTLPVLLALSTATIATALTPAPRPGAIPNAQEAPQQKAHDFPDGPMNAQWFYDKQNPYREANELLQEKKWQEAENKYAELILEGTGSDYDQEMAKLNRASCRMAQRKRATGWSSFDTLKGIPEEKQLPNGADSGEGKSVKIETDQIGIGDIYHFFGAVEELGKRGYKRVVVIRDFLKPRFEHAAKKYGFQLRGEKEEREANLQTDYEATIVGAYGHTNMSPEELCARDHLYQADPEALKKVRDLLDPLLAENKDTKVAVLVLGDNRSATLIGGKELPHDKDAHGRHLDSGPFNKLLEENPDLYFLDCGFGASKFNANDTVKDRVFNIPRDKGFDTFEATAKWWNAVVEELAQEGKDANVRVIGFGADNGPTNVLVASLNDQAQDSFAIIIPNSAEYDMRMHGDEKSPLYKLYAFGKRYRQMLSKCRVYMCNAPDDQEKMVRQIYNELLKRTP